MTVTPLRKDQFVMDEPIDPPAAVAVVTETPPQRRTRLLPEGLSLPTPRAFFDAAWPPVVGVAGFLLLWAVLAPLVPLLRGRVDGLLRRSGLDPNSHDGKALMAILDAIPRSEPTDALRPLR